MNYTIKRDGVEIKRVDSELAVVVYFHKTHSYSMSHALRYEGYTIEKEEASK
jgi:hypothetical protein